MDKFCEFNTIITKQNNIETEKNIITGNVDIINDATGEYIARFRPDLLKKTLREILEKNQTITDAEFCKIINEIRKDLIALSTSKKIYSRRAATGWYKKDKDGSMIRKKLNELAPSTPIGYFENQGRNNKCRLLRLVKKDIEHLPNFILLIEAVDRCFQKLMPKEHALQLSASTRSDFFIPKRAYYEFTKTDTSRMLTSSSNLLNEENIQDIATSFSTANINTDLPTACHKDTGDYKKGFGNLVVMYGNERGEKTYKGCYTILPGLKSKNGDCYAFNLEEGDFLAMDVHTWHGNSKIYEKTENINRISLVSYLRTKLLFCPTSRPTFSLAPPLSDYIEYVSFKIKSNEMIDNNPAIHPKEDFSFKFRLKVDETEIKDIDTLVQTVLETLILDYQTHEVKIDEMAKLTKKEWIHLEDKSYSLLNLTFNAKTNPTTIRLSRNPYQLFWRSTKGRILLQKFIYNEKIRK